MVRWLFSHNTLHNTQHRNDARDRKQAQESDRTQPGKLGNTTEDQTSKGNNEKKSEMKNKLAK